jgi:hypothetical protein
MSFGASNESSSPDEGQLVSLVTGVLVDPNLHTDVRMRLQRELAEILRSAQEETYGRSAPPGEQQLRAHRDDLPSLLQSVLVDPNLHTATRMRLHRKIGQMLQSAGHLSAPPA